MINLTNFAVVQATAPEYHFGHFYLEHANLTLKLHFVIRVDKKHLCMHGWPCELKLNARQHSLEMPFIGKTTDCMPSALCLLSHLLSGPRYVSRTCTDYFTATVISLSLEKQRRFRSTSMQQYQQWFDLFKSCKCKFLFCRLKQWKV